MSPRYSKYVRGYTSTPMEYKFDVGSESWGKVQSLYTAACRGKSCTLTGTKTSGISWITRAWYNEVEFVIIEKNTNNPENGEMLWCVQHKPRENRWKSRLLVTCHHMWWELGTLFWAVDEEREQVLEGTIQWTKEEEGPIAEVCQKLMILVSFNLRGIFFWEKWYRDHGASTL